MKKLFVPYEQAIKLRDLGFNEDCFGYYGEKLMGKQERFSLKLDWKPESYPFKDAHHCLAPTYQQIFDWFKDKYFYLINIGAYREDLRTKYYFNYSIHSYSETFTNRRLLRQEATWYRTYEEARFECLKYLIKIVENSQKQTT